MSDNTLVSNISKLSELKKAIPVEAPRTQEVEAPGI
jgi:hypothetical protein